MQTAKIIYLKEFRQQRQQQLEKDREEIARQRLLEEAKKLKW